MTDTAQWLLKRKPKTRRATRELVGRLRHERIRLADALEAAAASSERFGLGDVVYLRVDGARAGVVTGIMLRPGGRTYCVTWDDLDERQHYAAELTVEPMVKPG